MVLDTGAAFTVIDSSLMDYIGPEVGERNIRMPGAPVRIMKYYQGPSLKIGSVFDEHPEVMVSDLKTFVRLIGKPCVGLLGINVMKRGKILLNYDDRIFKIHVGPWSLNKSDFHEIELNQDSDVPEFHEMVHGHSINFLVDTGSNSCITLEASIFDLLVDAGIIELSKIKGRPASVAGMSSGRQGWFLKGELMGKNLAGVAVNSVPGISMVGLEWLYAFNTEIDFADHKLRYHLRGNSKQPCNTQLMTGAILLFGEGGALVERLRPGGGATENAGLKPGDVIQEFGPLKGTEMNETTIAETVADEADKEITIRYLRKADGKQISAKLKLPPIISDWNFSGRDIFNGK